MHFSVRNLVVRSSVAVISLLLFGAVAPVEARAGEWLSTGRGLESSTEEPSVAEDPQASIQSPHDGVAIKAKKRSRAKRVPFGKRRKSAEQLRAREDILARIRCEGSELTTCFIEPSFEEPGPLAPREVSEAEVDELLRQILDGLDAHEDAQIRAAEAELSEETFEEMAYFGATDHFLHPSTDLYKDPLKALSDRPQLYLDQIDPRDFDYPLVVNQRVQDWMVYFLTRGRKYYTRWLARAERYEPLIVPELEKAGLPKDLFFQAMIESGFNPYAKSWAKAVGVWQFMPRTGSSYGLRIDWWVDERRDPVLATQAAIALMSDLYRRWGSWELASASYNAGPGKISRAIKRYGTRDFWELTQRSRTYIKPETKHYVPKIIAAAILYKYADRYGLSEDVKDEDRLSPWAWDVVRVPEATDLGVIARCAGVDEEELVAQNPQLRRWCTPPGIENYPINLPPGTAEKFSRAFKKIPESERVTFERYRVKRGDTLGRIAQRFGTSVSSVMKLNSIRDARKLRVGQHLVLPIRAAGASRTLTHVVAKGESLSVIAQRYGLSVAELKRSNQLDRDTLAVGQRLTVSTKGGAAGGVTLASHSRSKPEAPTWYRVQGGDNLGRIATRFQTTVTRLKSLNGLRRDTIHPGQKLRLRGGSSGGGAQASGSSKSSGAKSSREVTRYVVRSGDVLGLVAQRHGMSTAELRKLNGLRGDVIKVGQKLKVYRRGVGASSRATIYAVKAGDSLWSVASRHNVSVAKLKAWNGLRGNDLRVGQKLKLQGGSSGAAVASSGSSSYKVRSGDTLWEIAREHGVSVDQLRSWNGIKGNALRAGQRLRVSVR